MDRHEMADGVDLDLSAGSGVPRTLITILQAFALVLDLSALPLTHTIGGKLRHGSRWKHINPFQGGKRFIILQAIAWTFYVLSSLSLIISGYVLFRQEFDRVNSALNLSQRFSAAASGIGQTNQKRLMLWLALIGRGTGIMPASPSTQLMTGLANTKNTNLEYTYGSLSSGGALAVVAQAFMVSSILVFKGTRKPTEQIIQSEQARAEFQLMMQPEDELASLPNLAKERAKKILERRKSVRESTFKFLRHKSLVTPDVSPSPSRTQSPGPSSSSRVGSRAGSVITYDNLSEDSGNYFTDDSHDQRGRSRSP
eukprot:g1847.t1